jgi:hypothetical protein
VLPGAHALPDPSGNMRALLIPLLATAAHAAPVAFDASSVRSGPWSDPATWNGKPPRDGESVQIHKGHTVVYDVASDDAFRVVHVAGTLTFSRDRNTLLTAGLIRISPGGTCSEDGFDCHEEAPEAAADGPLPALEIGTRAQPIPAGISARIRLRHFPGMNPETLPAIVACGGRWDVHGSPMPRTWLKLAATAKPGASEVTLAEPPTGWRPGQQVIVTGSLEPEFTKAQATAAGGATERRLISAIEGQRLTLDRPLDYHHLGESFRQSEAALLSRNVVIESAQPEGIRGHTMYHRDSAGGISYAEFRHLGKTGLLGKYAIHFHLAGNTMRGSGVTGASIWDSHNRWITIHGTDHLLVRDCVGYQSKGHGFFLEDATEQWNLLDRNLAVQATAAPRLPKQALPFDPNDGAGFWWANGRNAFTRNVACENDRYGFRFEVRQFSNFSPVLSLPRPDGKPQDTDVRHLPFLRFEANESHTEGLYSFNLGDDDGRHTSSDRGHPFIVRQLRAWETHYSLRPNLRFFLCDGLHVQRAVYGIYHPDYDHHVYRHITLDTVESEPINRGHDDESIQYGNFTMDEVTLRNCRTGRDPLIQLACTAPETVTGHFRGLIIENCRSESKVVDLGGGPRSETRQHPVVYIFHPSPATGGQTIEVVSRHFPDQLAKRGYAPMDGFTGPDVVASRTLHYEFPELLSPVDDLPPATMITEIHRSEGKLTVRGVSHDNESVQAITINGSPATIISQQHGVADWELSLPAADAITAEATDDAGNREARPHSIRLAP